MLNLKDPALLRQQCFIDGEWCDASDAATITVTNPATGETLGTVPRMGRQDAARAMNNAGQVVGLSYQGWDVHEAMLWEGGALFNLNSLIDPDSGWHLNDAGAINDHGQIAVSGCHQGLGVCGMLRLDPARMMLAVPEPSTWAMLLAGLALVGVRIRRHHR